MKRNDFEQRLGFAKPTVHWAGTENNLANALRILGERKCETELLEQAVIAFGAALKEYTRERVPLDWAGTQNDLGILAAMAMRKIGVMIARGDLAVECGYQRLAEVQEEILWIFGAVPDGHQHSPPP